MLASSNTHTALSSSDLSNTTTIQNNESRTDYDIKMYYSSVKESNDKNQLLYTVCPLIQHMSVTQNSDTIAYPESIKSNVVISLFKDAKVSDLMIECSKQWGIDVCNIISVL